MRDLEWVDAYVGLGSNLTTALGTPTEHIRHAIDRLQAQAHIDDVTASSLYASAPLGPQDQPDFINAVVSLRTTLLPLELLAVCQQLEQAAERQRRRHWGERSLDVDILLYGDAQIDAPTLTIPHPGLYVRNFVLIPLLELSPDLEVAGTRLAKCEQSQNWTGLSKLAAQ